MGRRCDVLIVGGGPAGSTCAHALVRAGLDVVVTDRATFPRHKPCAGWITPEVVEALELDLVAYARAATLQPILGFQTGVIGGPRIVTRYEQPVSFAIRRCEFDAWLLGRCGAEVREATPVTRLERAGDAWRTDAGVEARMLVGAGGHFCPVARWFSRDASAETTVVAQEVEVRLQSPVICPVSAEVPELYFCRDLRGYGWCVRKGDFLNVGCGRLGHQGLRGEIREFLAGLRRAHRVPEDFPDRWHGHAYRVYAATTRPLVADGVVLVGDAAGLANPVSGEGILPAVLSGKIAAEAIVNAAPDFTRARLNGYEDSLRNRLGAPVALRRGAPPLARARAWAGRRLLASPWFARHVLVPREFLHRSRGRAIA